MDLDPIDIGEYLKIQVGLSYLRGRGRIFKNFIKKFEPNDKTRVTFEEKLEGFIKFKGPYIQSLEISEKSERDFDVFAGSIKTKLAPNGLEPEIIDTFIDLKFKKLYKFQEESIKTLLEEFKNLLITAPTGRGKTEAWLIALLNIILLIKRGKIPGITSNTQKFKSTKLILLYPTNSLAQDQFKRLIKYLSILNEKITKPKERITLGIYNGDTPRIEPRNKHIHSYLNPMFKVYECPLFDQTNKDCKTCVGSLQVKSKNPDNSPSSRRRAILTIPGICGQKLEYPFLYLTRDDIEEYNVDIIITNPEIVNYRLFNINDTVKHQKFILDPLFYIIDEAHAYKGIFGAYASMIFKRLRQTRLELIGEENSNFYVIGCSATIANRKELFSKLISNHEFEEINAKNIEFPESYINFSLKDLNNIKNLIDKAYTSDNLESLLFELKKIEPRLKKLISSDIENERVIEQNQELLINYFFENHNNDNELWNLIRFIYFKTVEKPSTQPVLISEICKNFNLDLTKTEKLILFNNLYLIGFIAGIIENRSHLFGWPIDGFYGCINCGKIYEERTGVCSCKNSFITKIVYCEFCGDHFYESWYCPECMAILSSTVNNEGLFNKYDQFFCPHKHETDDLIECTRIIWKPLFECPRCHSVFSKRDTPICPKCKQEYEVEWNGKKRIKDFLELIIKDNKEYYFCPKCETTYDIKEIERIEDICYNNQCEGHISDYQIKNILKDECGHETNYNIKNTDGICPVCGKTLLEHRNILPWICIKCGESHISRQPPKLCKNAKCSSTKFYLDAFFDVKSVLIPKEDGIKKNEEYIKKITKYDDFLIEDRFFTTYKFINQDFKVSDTPPPGIRHYFFDGKCEYGNTTKLDKRFREISYTPIFTTTRVVQFTLRYFAQKTKIDFDYDEILKTAKVLTFSDNIREMDQLARNLYESEINLFLTQVIFHILDSNTNGINLEHLTTETIKYILNWFESKLDLSDADINRYLNRFRRFLQNSNYQVKWAKCLFDRSDVNSIIKELVREIILYPNNPRKFIKDGIIEFDIEDEISDEDRSFLKSIEVHTVYPRTLQSLSWDPKENEKLEKLNKQIEEDLDEKTYTELLKKKNEQEEKIAQLTESVKQKLEGLIDRGLIIRSEYKNLVIYGLNPKKLKIYLVSSANPNHYNKIKDEFLPSFYFKLNRIKKTDYRDFNIPPHQRGDYRRKFYSRNIDLLVNYYPILFISQSYKGETRVEERREIENKFKKKKDLHNISSGPAMELGIDIGDLNLIVLYGTPPNVNSYIQRIGRAGRKLKKSLITSISKRNPIDYYYYRKPYELITSEPQRVPINDKNKEVIKISLVWSIFDYINNKIKNIWK